VLPVECESGSEESMHRERVAAALESRGAGPLSVAGNIHPSSPNDSAQVCALMSAAGAHQSSWRRQSARPRDRPRSGSPHHLGGLGEFLLREGCEYVDEWGVSWLSAPYETPYGVGHYTEPRGHPLAEADAKAVARYRPPDPGRPELYTDAERLIAEHGAEYWIVGSTVTTIFETGGHYAGSSSC